MLERQRLSRLEGQTERQFYEGSRQGRVSYDGLDNWDSEMRLLKSENFCMNWR